MRRFRVLSGIALLGLGVYSSAIAAGQAVAMRSAGDQKTPAVARNAAGAGVVVWAGPNDPTDLTEIFARRYDAAGAPGIHLYARRFDATGAPLGSEFRVDGTDSPLVAAAPDVAVNASGDAQQIGTRLKQPESAYDADGGLALVADDRDIRLYRFDAVGSQNAVRTIEGERPRTTCLRR